jgi:AraC-like DNA-binding protein
MVTASPHLVLKGKSDIAASTSECYYVNLQLSGRCRITQAEETVQIRAGQIAIFDSARPFALDHGEMETLQVVSLMVPKAHLSKGPTAAPQVLSDHPVYGAALGQAAIAISPTVRAGGHDALLRLRDVILGLTDLALCDAMSNNHPGTRRNAQYYRMCDLVRRHCRDPLVGIEQISSMLGLSVGTVRNIFTEHDDTFGRRLLHERVELAKLVLKNPRNAHLTVAEVAFCCGFSDVAHFGRTFKDNTGMAPGAWRKSLGRKLTVPG